MFRLSAAVSALMTLAGSLTGQATVTVPANVGPTDAISRGRWAGFDSRSRQQVIVADSMLRSIRGRALTALWVRRDHALGLPLSASRSNIALRIATSRTPPSAPSPSFLANSGAAATTVFAGPVSLPASGPVTQNIPWDSTHAVKIPFQTRYRYSLGDLCIEVEGEPLSPGAFWPVDWVHEGEPGSVSYFGSACGAPAASFDNVAGAWSRFTYPGGTLPLSAMGRAGTPAFMIFGSSRLQPPLDLGFIGAPGCKLHVRPVLSISALYDLPDTSRALAKARIDLDLPALTSMLSAKLYLQWANLERAQRSNPLGLTTSNGVEVEIASMMPPGRISSVLSEHVAPNAPFPATGRVEISRGPVLRFEIQ